MDETDVLVVGAGPTGLTLATELFRHGVRCRIIDQAPVPAATSRALGLQPRTLEVFAAMGVVDAVLARGGWVGGANFYDRDDLIATFNATRVEKLHTPYPRIWITPQSSVEGSLTEWLGALGGTVERPSELVDFRDPGSHVAATIRCGEIAGGAPTVVRAGWLVGCDGAHSRVRKGLGLDFAGQPYDERFLLADVDLDWTRARDRLHSWPTPAGVLAVLPLLGTDQWRLIASRRQETAPLSLDLIRRLFQQRTGDTSTTIANPTWLSDFSVHHRMVKRYRLGRVFLAGDAAHIHSPIGGQGMNTGIQDAYNLAWKLALVVRGAAPASLLDTYEAERLPVARGVVAGTNAGTKLLLSRNPAVRFLRRRVFALGAVQNFLAQNTSELRLHYRGSSLAATAGDRALGKSSRPVRRGKRPNVADRLVFWAGPRAGDRAPDGPAIQVATGAATTLFREFRGTDFALLLFAGTRRPVAGDANLATIARGVAGRFAEEITMHIIVAADEVPPALDWHGSILLDEARTLHGRYGAATGALYLIRPDGYVGFRGPPAALASLQEYLAQIVLPSKNSRAADDGGRETVTIPAADSPSRLTPTATVRDAGGGASGETG